MTDDTETELTMPYPPIEDPVVSVTVFTKLLTAGEKFILPAITAIGAFLGGGWWARKKVAADAGKTSAEAEVTLSEGAIRRAEDMRKDLDRQDVKIEAMQIKIDALQARAILRDQENMSLQAKVIGQSVECSRCKMEYDTGKSTMLAEIMKLRTDWEQERSEFRAEIKGLKAEILRLNTEIERLLNLLDKQGGPARGGS